MDEGFIHSVRSQLAIRGKHSDHRAAVEALVACGLAGSQAALISPLRLSLAVDVGCGFDYDRPPDGDYLFYEGEQIRVKLLIGNYDDVRGHELQSLGTQGTTTFQAVVTKDGKPYDVRLEVGPELEQMDLSSTIVRDWAPRMQVEPSTSLVWRGELTARWEPGIYFVDIVPLATDEEERPIVLERFAFEWREFAP